MTNAFCGFNNSPKIVFNKVLVNEILFISFSKTNNIFKILGFLTLF